MGICSQTYVVRSFRSANREILDWEDKDETIGFRVALSVGHHPPSTPKPDLAKETPKPVPPPQSIKNTVGIEFLRIPAGEFMMSRAKYEGYDKNTACSDGELRRRTVIDKPFYMGKLEVSFDLASVGWGGLP